MTRTHPPAAAFAGLVTTGVLALPVTSGRGCPSRSGADQLLKR